MIMRILTFLSDPSLPMVRKSKCTYSRGYVQIINFISSLSCGCLNLVHHLQEWMCNLTSSDIFGQKNQSFNRPSVFSIPKWQKSSWHAKIAYFWNCSGRMNCCTLSWWSFNWTLWYSKSFFRHKSWCYFNRTLIPEGSPSLALYWCNCLVFIRFTTGPISGSSTWACFHCVGVSFGLSLACIPLDRILSSGGTIRIELSHCVPCMRADLIRLADLWVPMSHGILLRASASTLCLPLW